MNPFLPYLPCYAPGTVAERPMWRADRPTVLRLIYRRTDGAEVAVSEGEDPLAALDAYDLAHPLPVPPVLAGQVWADPRGYAVAITCAVPGESGAMMFLGPDSTALDECCLVWGPLAPWAPPGWRP